jgi:hypothetical protein
LAFGEVLDPEKAVAGGLGSVGDDGQLLAQETVEERRLAGIGPPDKGDKAGFEIRSVFSGHHGKDSEMQIANFKMSNTLMIS